MRHHLYQTNYDALHAIASACTSSAVSCSLAIYQRDVAEADLTQAQKRQTAEAQYQLDLYNAAATELNKTVLAETDLAALQIQTDWSYAMKAAPRAWQSAIDTAQSEWTLATGNGLADAQYAFDVTKACIDFGEKLTKLGAAYVSTCAATGLGAGSAAGSTSTGSGGSSSSSSSDSSGGPTDQPGGPGQQESGHWRAYFNASNFLASAPRYKNAVPNNWGDNASGCNIAPGDIDWGYFNSCGPRLSPPTGPGAGGDLGLAMEAGGGYVTYTWIVDTPATTNGPPNSGPPTSGPPNSNPDDPNDNPNNNPDDGCSADSGPSTPESCPSDGPIGDAKIAYAASLGAASIALAQTKGNAAIAYQSGLLLAATDGDTSALDESRTNTLIQPQLQYDVKVAVARRQQTTDENAAQHSRALTEGSDAVGAAHDRAAAETTYQVAVAEDQAARLASLASSTDSTDQQKFDSIAANAKVDWLTDLSQAYITHVQALANIDELTWPLKVSDAQGQEEYARIWADSQLMVDTDAAGTLRQKQDQLANDAFNATDIGAALAREAAHALDQALLDVQLATANKLNAVQVATADKKQSVTTAGNANAALGFNGPDQTHQLDLAAAALAFASNTEDAKLLFQQKETIARTADTLQTALNAKTRALNLDANAKQEAASDADFQRDDLDAAYASSEEADWSAEAAADENAKLAAALADITWSSAQESANISAAHAIDDDLAAETSDGHHLPWGQFLVAQLTAHADWWQSVKDDYKQWVIDENAQEDNWQLQVNTAHNLEATTERTTRHDLAVASAVDTQTADDGLALTVFTEITESLTPAAKLYADTLAQASHDYAIGLAQAAYDGVLNDDPDEEETERAAAETAFGTTVGQAQIDYASTSAIAASTRITTEAQLHHQLQLSIALNEKSGVETDISAQEAFEEADARQRVSLSANQSALEKAIGQPPPQASASWLTIWLILTTPAPRPRHGQSTTPRPCMLTMLGPRASPRLIRPSK